MIYAPASRYLSALCSFVTYLSPPPPLSILFSFVSLISYLQLCSVFICCAAASGCVFISLPPPQNISLLCVHLLHLNFSPSLSSRCLSALCSFFALRHLVASSFPSLHLKVSLCSMFICCILISPLPLFQVSLCSVHFLRRGVWLCLHFPPSTSKCLYALCLFVAS